ncbi:MAG: CHC2 zinc finger domain-containing protein [Gammaproteobacteria bacterium]|nr:CHC2 zinc finger domain-containing protein [Gammaproteobacteria bacterium]
MSILQTLLERDGIHLPKTGGAEKSIKCFMPNHDNDSLSMSVNVAKSVYFCHWCKATGNPYTYLTDVRGISKPEAMQMLESLGATKANLDHYQTADRKNKEERARAESGLPKVAKAPYDSLGPQFNGYLTATYKYYKPEDQVTLKHPIIVQRWEEKQKNKKTGEPKTKKTLLTFLPRAQGDYWVTKPDNDVIPPEDRVTPVPLYGIEHVKPVLEKYRNAPDIAKPQVWVVEGEKCRDMVARIKKKKPPACVSPYGGPSRAVGTTDWTPLFGQRVLLIADADNAGRRFMKAIGRHLHKNGASVKYFLPKGDTGYDIYDALVEDGWDSMMEWINEHGGVKEYADVHPSDSKAEEKFEMPPLDDCQFFTVHGFEDEKVVIQSKETHYMHKVPAKKLTSEGQLLCLAPLAFWRSLAPNGQITQPIRSMCADKIIRAAKAKGQYLPNDIDK